MFVKRDDLTGLGLGGNKVRKLEFLLADAKQKGCEIVFTTGGAQSNHAMLTAAAAKRLGMTPILILKKRGVTATRGNLLLSQLGRFIGTGGCCSVIIVLFVLPGLLYLLDRLFIKKEHARQA